MVVILVSKYMFMDMRKSFRQFTKSKMSSLCSKIQNGGQNGEFQANLFDWLFQADGGTLSVYEYVCGHEKSFTQFIKIQNGCLTQQKFKMAAKMPKNILTYLNGALGPMVVIWVQVYVCGHETVINIVYENPKWLPCAPKFKMAVKMSNISLYHLNGILRPMVVILVSSYMFRNMTKSFSQFT